MPTRKQGQSSGNRGLPRDQPVLRPEGARSPDVRPYSSEAQRIAKLPVDQWRNALAEVAESERELVRADLTEIWQGKKQAAKVEADIEAGIAVWMHIRCGESL